MTILGADVGERRRLAGEKGRIGEEGGGSAQEEQEEEMMAGRLRLLRRDGCSQSCADQQAPVPCLNCSTAPSLYGETCAKSNFLKISKILSSI